MQKSEQRTGAKKENTALIYWIWCNFHQDPLLIPLALFWLLIVNRHLQIEATFKKFDQTGNDKLNLREFGEMMNKRSDQGRKKSETSKKEESQSEGNSTKSWSFDKFKIMCSPLRSPLAPITALYYLDQILTKFSHLISILPSKSSISKTLIIDISFDIQYSCIKCILNNIV